MEMTAPVLVKIPEETKMWEPAIYTLNFLLPAAYQEKPPVPTNDKVSRPPPPPRGRAASVLLVPRGAADRWTLTQQKYETSRRLIGAPDCPACFDESAVSLMSPRTLL